MKNITSSASKLVLLYIVAILGLLTLFAGCYSVMTNTFGDAAKLILGAFSSSLTFVLGFYFGYKGDAPAPGSTVKTEKKETIETPEVVGSFGGK